eukprot:767409-Hanusia_phi.AAC.8
MLKNDTMLSKICQEGDTPLHIAVSWGHLELARMMIGRNANLKLRNDQRKTAFDLASAGEADDQQNVRYMPQLLCAGFRKQLNEIARIRSS